MAACKRVSFYAAITTIDLLVEMCGYGLSPGILNTLTLSLPNMTKVKFDKNPKFYFVKFFKTNNTK